MTNLQPDQLKIYYQHMQIKLILLAVFLILAFTGCSKPEPPTINLYRAVHLGDIDQIERNLYWDAEVDQPGPDGRSALHVAVNKGSLVIAKMLLDDAANIEVKDRNGQTPLAAALLAGNTLVAEFLVKRGAEVDGNALLHETVRQGKADRDVVDFLTQHGANLDDPNAQGNTPLHVATSLGHRKVAKYLISKGSDISRVNAAGETALDIAIRLGEQDIEQMLRKFGATTTPQ